VIEVLAETPELVAVDKPPGIATIPDRAGAPGLQQQLESERGERLWVVHRLDREVGGILVFARTAAAHRALCAAFESRDVSKVYRAITEGEPPGPPGWSTRWEDLLAHGKRRTFAAPHGKSAITQATYEGQLEGGASWKLEPLTGRTHQLRVHLARFGHPILGDALYGATRPWTGRGIALRAVGLAIPARGAFPGLALEILFRP
jgi:tRNA pseudouridine32 synthase/23S rRNA pseudouridine746 synthase